MSMGKLWGGRFSEQTDTLVEQLNASVSFDKRLYRHDILGSIAHAIMLGTQGIISQEERKTITTGLAELLDEIEAGRFEWRIDREDVHMNVEAALADHIGAAAGKLHTARSRNDQVALDVRLWLRDRIVETAGQITAVQAALLYLANGSQTVLMPGYTHLQRAQPIVAAHHFLAYFEMFERDCSRFLDGLQRTNVMPLGSGALAGTPFPIDRGLVRKLLRFDGITRNSLDAVSDRDFVLEFMSAAAITQMHLSRLAEELVLWMTNEFAFIKLPDGFCTGSSIMPQKKNPDIPELIRGKAGRVYGDLMALLTTMKGLPLAYNKDMQEDKEPLFDAADTVLSCLTIAARMLERAEIQPEKMRRAIDEGFLTATDLADALAATGLPFREAHHVVGKVVAYCVDRNMELNDLSPDELTNLTGQDGSALIPWLDPVSSVRRRDVPGGPAPIRVAAALDDAAQRLSVRQQHLDQLRSAFDLDHLLLQARL